MPVPGEADVGANAATPSEAAATATSESLRNRWSPQVSAIGAIGELLPVAPPKPWRSSLSLSPAS